MNFDTFLRLIETAAVIFGIVFAIFQVRQYRKQREREAAIMLLHQFQTPEFAKAIQLVFNLSDGLSKDQMVLELGDDFPLVYALMTAWESIGILVYRGELTLDLVDDFYSGPILISWHKLKNHTFAERQEQNRETIEEWFQWLAEQMMARESTTPPVPAHIAHKDWHPPKPS